MGHPVGPAPCSAAVQDPPEFPSFCLKHVHFPRIPFSALAHQDSPGPGHRRDDNKEPASGGAPLWGVQLGAGGTNAWISHGSGGSQSIPVWVPSSPGLGHCVSMATHSPCRRGILGFTTSSPAFVFPAFVSCSALAASQARHPFQSSLCFIGEIAGQKYM